MVHLQSKETEMAGLTDLQQYPNFFRKASVSHVEKGRSVFGTVSRGVIVGNPTRQVTSQVHLTGCQTHCKSAGANAVTRERI